MRPLESLAQLEPPMPNGIEPRFFRSGEELRDREDEFRVLSEAVQDLGVVLLDANGCVSTWNVASERVFGYCRDEILGRPFSLFFPDDDVENGVPEECLRQAAQGDPHDFEGWRLRKGGGRFYSHCTLEALTCEDGSVRGYSLVARDITEKKRSESGIRALLDQTAAGITLLSSEGKLLLASQKTCDIVGYTPEELQQLTLNEITHPNDRAEDLAQFNKLLSGELSSYMAVKRLTHKSGAHVWVNVAMSMVRDPGTCQPTVGVGVILDINEQVEAQEALRRSEERFRIAIASANALVFDWDLPSGVVEMAGGFDQALGYAPGEFLNTMPALIAAIHPEDRAAVEAAIDRSLHADTAFEAAFRFVRKDGAVQYWTARGAGLKDETGSPYRLIGAATEITEQTNLERQLSRAQKMEAVGRLAGGVAHDFNNMLAVIMGYSGLLLDRSDLDARARSALDGILGAANRAAGLTRQLLVFSRQEATEPKKLDINEAVRESIKMLGRLIDEDIELSTTLHPSPLTVVADPGQLEQILMNLAINARDAMPEGGRMFIETQRVDLDEAYARSHANVKAGRHALLTVTDTGQGMDTETLSHIFEPFFTTKESGKGTGLGLATVYGIVQRSEGHIQVYSEPGHGSCFKVYLPEADPGEEQAKPVESSSLPRGIETILVAEDEELLRGMVHATLEPLGYKILVAADGDEALRICESHCGTIHLLLTDMVMPRMSGRDLADRVQAVRPGIEVLFMSGYTEDSIRRRDSSADGRSFVHKPFSSKKLVETIRAILEEP